MGNYKDALAHIENTIETQAKQLTQLREEKNIELAEQLGRAHGLLMLLETEDINPILKKRIKEVLEQDK
jgi:hypothetical protein